MPQSTDVNLPRNHSARFPSSCVRCGDDPANGTVRLWTHTIGWSTWVFWMFGRGFSTHAPACAGCGWRIRFQRVGGVLLTLAIAGVFLFFVWPHIENFIARPIRKWVAMGLILVCLAPYILWEMFFPPAIDITAYSESIDYEFRDSDYAFDFAELNDDAEWVRIN